MRAHGYGSDLEYDGSVVTFHLGKTAAKISGTETIRVPIGDVERVEFKPSSMLINGHLRLHVRDTSMEKLWSYAETQNVDSRFGPNRVNPNSLEVVFRKKDQADFAAVNEALLERVPSA